MDASACGRFRVTGKDRREFLHRMCTQDVRGLAAGTSRLAAFVTAKGRLLDAVTLADCGDFHLMITSPARRESLVAWLTKYVLADDVRFTDLSGEGGAIRIAGPEVHAVARTLGLPPAALEPGRISGVPVEGMDATIVAEAGPRPSVLLLAESPGVNDLLSAAFAAAAAAGGGPAGEIARQAVRVDEGVPEAGAEITEDWNPWEAGLDAAISLSKGCYIGQEVVARLNTYDKVSRRLVRLALADSAPVAARDPMRAVLPAGWTPGAALRHEGKDAGRVTSTAPDPRTGAPIALGYLRGDRAAQGMVVDVAAGGGAVLPARVR